MRALSTNRVIGGIVGVIAAVAMGLLFSRSLLIAWLCAFVFFTFGALGALMFDGMLALGGAQLRAAWRIVTIRAVQWIAISPILYLPLAIGMRRLFSWSSSGFAEQTWFLNYPFALMRAFVYFVVGFFAARFISANEVRASTTALALLALFVTANLAAIDWIMALAPAWHSSDLGLRWCANGLLTSAAIAVAFHARGENSVHDLEIRQRLDGANVLFALNLGWIYLMFVDYITAWSGNLPDEAGWYVTRFQGIWLPMIVVIVACHMVVGMMLLFRGVKHSEVSLRWIAGVVLIAQWLETVWTIAPQADDAGSATIGLAAIATCVLVAASLFWIGRPPESVHAIEAPAHG